MPNAANINRLIEHLQSDNGSHFRMANFADYTFEGADIPIKVMTDPKQIHTCKTAFCIAGWVNALTAADSDGNRKIGDLNFGSESRAADWLGIDSEQGENLFFMVSADPELEEFDELPDAIRKRAAIAVLEHLRDTGEVDWDRAIELAMAQKVLPALITDLLNPENKPAVEPVA